MKSYLLVLLFISTSLFGQVQTRVDTIYRTDGVYTVKSEFLNGLLDGIRIYYKDGLKYVAQTFKEGMADGPEYWYHTDGKTVKYQWVNKGGYTHGLFIHLDESGQVVGKHWYYGGDAVTEDEFQKLVGNEQNLSKSLYRTIGPIR